MPSPVRAAWRLRVSSSEKPQEHSKGQLGHRDTAKGNLATKNPVRLTGTLQSFCSNTIQWQPVLTATEIPFCWQRYTSLAMHTASFCFPDTRRSSQTLEPNLHTPSLPNTQPSRVTAKDKTRFHQVIIWPQADWEAQILFPLHARTTCGSMHLSYWVPKNGTNSKKGHWVLHMQLTCSSWVSSGEGHTKEASYFPSPLSSVPAHLHTGWSSLTPTPNTGNCLGCWERINFSAMR